MTSPTGRDDSWGQWFRDVKSFLGGSSISFADDSQRRDISWGQWVRDVWHFIGPDAGSSEGTLDSSSTISTINFSQIEKINNLLITELLSPPYDAVRTLKLQKNVVNAAGQLEGMAALKKKLAVAWLARRVGASIGMECRPAGNGAVEELQKVFFASLRREGTLKELQKTIKQVEEKALEAIDARDLGEVSDQQQRTLKDSEQRAVQHFLKGVELIGGFAPGYIGFGKGSFTKAWDRIYEWLFPYVEQQNFVTSLACRVDDGWGAVLSRMKESFEPGFAKSATEVIYSERVNSPVSSDFSTEILSVT